MKDALKTVSDWLSAITDLLVSLLALGVVIGILFDDKFGVIEGIGNLMAKFGENGLAGLVALFLIVTWYQKSKAK
ncbi:MAG: hypothetical protein HN995_09515 [Candidatus Marinimicrobia bacterium]|jgi:hypothetical protein|nr:hypothetical protein [Candidatus Neomarinimicrobiota bacterium]MBT4129718.1 hypothetical protein [Candidatus Neomarinimicrobiota bacterium]MBT4296839.1 hypothetical protein [Candidatus Neomarinimicrobiota bacterium]MBT4419258.1 hypothetical protein [Candidatus Neomarinimicrobiota bacterium]MBT4993396.1 hypothetical protein [Candidatus Neomarinimicrobiota bacterium]